MSDAIRIDGITKTFGDKIAVNDLQLSVPQGGLYGFIGPNGAGKTTTIRMVMSILFPDRGTISVLDHDSALDAKDRIGYLPEERGVYKKMKVGAFLQYMAKLKGRPDQASSKTVQDWLGRVGLGEVVNKRCEELSKGMQQKIQFIATVIHEPDLLILDEPFSGLDPVNMRLLRDLVLEQHGRGATIIFSTHVMTQAEQICNHIVMINEGRKVLDDTIQGIRTRFDPRTILLEPMTAGDSGEPLRAVADVESVADGSGCFEISLVEGADPARAMSALAAAVPAARIELHRPTLEDVFVQLVAAGSKTAEDVERLRASLRADSAVEVPR